MPNEGRIHYNFLVRLKKAADDRIHHHLLAGEYVRKEENKLHYCIPVIKTEIPICAYAFRNL
jgi:hypothetical protein